jgi:hypothetical protein
MVEISELSRITYEKSSNDYKSLSTGRQLSTLLGSFPANIVFGREFGLTRELLFWALHDKERPTIDHAANFMDHFHDIHNYVRQHLKLVGGQMESCNNRPANSSGYHEVYLGSLYRPNRMKGKSPEHQSSL